MALAAPLAAGPTVGRHRVGGRRVMSSVLLLVGCATFVVAALFLAPAAVGGPASYVVTSGTSMLPTYEAGGVIVTQERDSYGVGDVVAYRNPQLGDTVVMHRIVDTDVDTGQFVLRGDNNNFRDSYHPTQDEIVGEAWGYFPGAGQALQAVRQPVVFGLIIAGLTLISLWSPRTADRRRRRHHES